MANANDNISLCDNMVKKFRIKIKDHVVRDDFYIFPMCGLPHMVLGV